MASIRETVMNNFFTELDGYKKTGELTISEVSRFDEDILDARKWESPLIMIDDLGDDELRVQDSTHYRYISNVIIRGYVKEDTAADLHPTLNRLISTIKQWIDSVPALGTSVLELRYLNNGASRFDKEHSQADCTINARLTWTCANGAF